jgi:glycosyltransferase involved in cell wall biosynthesis
MISIITYADLGKRKNLKTPDILPVIEIFQKRGILYQVICRIGKGFGFKNTYSAVPLFLHYLSISSGKIINNPTLGRILEEKIFNFFAKRYLKQVDVAFFHPDYLAPNAYLKAKKMGIITIGIAATAHLLYNAELEKEEFEILGLKNYYPKNTIWSKFTKYYNLNYQHDYLITLSEFAAKTYIGKGIPANRIFVVYQDIDVKRFLSQNRFQNKNKKFKVLFVSYISPLKGLHYLLEAWQKLKLKEAELIIVGGYAEIPTPLKKRYDEIIKKDSSIKWVGFTKNPELYYSSASIFVMPSLTEAGPRVVLEAMASGLPVITTENAKNLVEDGKNGFVVPIRNVEAIKEKIEFFYYNRDIIEKMGEEAKKTIENKKPFGEAVFEIYQKIINK